MTSVRLKIQPLRSDESSEEKLSGFDVYAPWAICLYGLVAALSIALSQVLVVTLTLLWLLFTPKRQPHQLERVLIMSQVLFLCCALIAACLGLQPSRALIDLAKTGFALLFPFVIAATLDPLVISAPRALKRVEMYFCFFALGQLIAGVHSLGSAYAGMELPIKIPGPVTESGQLVLLIPLLVGISLQSYTNSSSRAVALFWAQTFLLLIVGQFIAWPQVIFESMKFSAATLALLAICGVLVFSFWQAIGRSDSEKLRSLLPLILGILFAVAVINLKRGPWLGLCLAFTVLGLCYSRRLIVFSALIVTTAIVYLEPVRERLFAFASHFTIAGGRQSMWEIGMTLVQRFPLGLGLDNARYMRVIDPTLPFEHRHMHNNLLNIAVEVGFAGLVCYLWWIGIILLLAWRVQAQTSQSTETKKLQIVVVAIGAALLGWQASGLVEYNFGDGEIRLIAFTLIGILIGLARHFESESAPIQV